MKRTPLRRTSQLQPGEPPCRTVALQPGGPWSRSVPMLAGKSAATKRGSSTGGLIPPAPGEFTDAVKLAVRKRAGRGDAFEARCEACPAHLGEKGGEFQHRDARGMGGSKDPVVNGIAGCVLLCHGCHMLAEARDRDMLGMGFWLENGQDPRLEPIMLHGAGGGGLSLWLAEDGIGDKGTGYLYEAPKELVA